MQWDKRGGLYAQYADGRLRCWYCRRTGRGCWFTVLGDSVRGSPRLETAFTRLALCLYNTRNRRSHEIQDITSPPAARYVSRSLSSLTPRLIFYPRRLTFLTWSLCLFWDKRLWHQYFPVANLPCAHPDERRYPSPSSDLRLLCLRLPQCPIVLRRVAAPFFLSLMCVWRWLIKCTRRSAICAQPELNELMDCPFVPRWKGPSREKASYLAGKQRPCCVGR